MRPDIIAPDLEDLPQRDAAQVKCNWADVVRALRDLGCIAVVQNDQVEMVMMSVEAYQKASALAEDARARSEAQLAELAAEFDERLVTFKTEGIRGRVERVMSAQGRLKRPPKAGTTY